MSLLITYILKMIDFNTELQTLILHVLGTIMH